MGMVLNTDEFMRGGCVKARQSDRNKYKQSVHVFKLLER